MDVHVGTHVDAPAHFIEGGATLDAVGLDPFLGPAYVAEIDATDRIDAAALEAAEIPDGTERLLLRTRNSSDDAYLHGPFREDFAALTAEGARWVVERGLALVGIDYLSIQRFDDPPDTHRILLGAGVCILEGIDLRAVGEGRYRLVCLRWRSWVSRPRRLARCWLQETTRDPRAVAFVPMRHESERVPGKNYRPLAGKPLFHHIVSTLLAVPEIDLVAIDTDSPTIASDAADAFPDVLVLDRPAHLLGGDVPMNEILLHDVDAVEADLYLQTHSTNPLLRAATISAAIAAFSGRAGPARLAVRRDTSAHPPLDRGRAAAQSRPERPAADAGPPARARGELLPLRLHRGEPAQARQPDREAAASLPDRPGRGLGHRRRIRLVRHREARRSRGAGLSDLRVLVTCPQMQNVFEQFSQRLDERGIAYDLPPVVQQPTEDELIAVIGGYDGMIAATTR